MSAAEDWRAWKGQVGDKVGRGAAVSLHGGGGWRQRRLFGRLMMCPHHYHHHPTALSRSASF